MKIYFDGGCRPNPGQIETALVAAGRTCHRADHGLGDNNDAEWLALLEALSLARDQGLSDVILLGDSATVIDQVKGSSRRIAPRFRQYHDLFHTLLTGMGRVRIRRVPRSQNLAGIVLEQLRGNCR